MKLAVDADELASCVSCGLCLPHCPTYRVTGEEALSPRGRIAAMRAVDAGAPLTAGFLHSIDTCVQCRGCETACPSGVPFGHLMEGTRSTVVAARPARRTRALRVAYRVLEHPRLLRALTVVGGIAQRARLLPPRASRRFGLPERLPLRRLPLRATGTDAWLFTGCVMDAWQRGVHDAVVRVAAAAGFGIALADERAGCCGALHVHAGFADDARRLATRVLDAFPGDAPIVVDAAGCGAALKDYGRLLGTPEAVAFSARVVDVHEWLGERLDALPPAVRPLGRVAVQDPCHLRHVQRVHGDVRVVLARYAELVEVDDDGLCCGAGGAYAAVQPDLARSIRERKLGSIARAGADVVASANPGCAIHLSNAGVRVRHPVELVDDAISEERANGR